MWTQAADFFLALLLLTAVVVRVEYGLAAAHAFLMLVNAVLAAVMVSAGFPASAIVFGLSVPINFYLRAAVRKSHSQESD